ncbi:anti-sigma factor [Caulobacter sp. 1776]|uniref:anti-sigma factor family protein n=1 Tax=Caulobacter sp. 1776 TaxID=3156420 RepID=UPI003395215D
MSDCDTNRLLLQAMMDGELDAAGVLRVEQHLKTCAACAQALEDLRLVRGALATPGVAHAAPESFKRRMAIAIDAETRAARHAPRRQAGYAGVGALASLAALAMASVLIVTGVGQMRTGLADELVADHVRSLQANHLVDVETSNRHVVKPWFDGKVAFAPTVVDFADRGFPLAGGRLDYVQGQPAAALVYRRSLHVINVFVWPGDAPTDRFGVVGQRNGYALLHWRAGGLNYWAVSDLDPAELRRFRDLYVDALK